MPFFRYCKSFAKALLAPAIRFILRHPRLKSFFMARLQKHPGLMARLRQIVATPAVIPLEGGPSNFVATLGELPPRGKHFYDLLLSEISSKDEGV